MEGPRAVGAALDLGVAPDELVVADGVEPDLVARARTAGSRVTTVAAADLARAVTTRTPQPVAAVVAWRPVTAEAVAERSRATGLPVVVLAGVADPGNAGTILRAAAAAGAAGVLLTAGSVDPANPKCVRASAGALFAVPVAPVADLAAVAALGLATVGADAGGRPLDEVDLGGPRALVLGAEAAGLADGGVDESVALPMEPGVESLNVAMAATVLLYEARRRRSAGTDWTEGDRKGEG